MLERSTPFYIQITRILRQELFNGLYPVASRMPDENFLASRFGVSRDVIRKSMRQLAMDGLVKPIRSKGTFVCEKKESCGHNFVLLSYHGSLHLDFIRRGIENCMGEADNLILKTNSLDELEMEAQLLQHIDCAETRALIAAPAYDAEKNNARLYERLLRSGVPVLIIDHSLPEVQADEISFDEYGSMVRLTHEALSHAEHLKTIVLCPTSNPDRIVGLRCKAMRDAFQEVGGNVTGNRKLIEFEYQGYDYRDNALKMLEACQGEALSDCALFCYSTPYAWELEKLLREQGRGGQVRLFSGVGDIFRGDEDFNHRLYAHYRLFDDFLPLISEVLRARLSDGAAPGVPIRRTVGFREMDYHQIVEYYTSHLG